MLAEAINTIAGLVETGNAIETFRCDDLRKVLVRRGKEIEMHDLPPVQRGGRLHGVEDLVAAALDDEFAPDPEVFHEGDGIVLVLNRADRHELVKMPLTCTDRFLTLMSLAKTPRNMAPREWVRFLRFDLSGTGIDHVIAVLRKVDFARRSDGKMHVEHGRESLGRSVEMVVQTPGDAIPETFDVTVPVYATPGLRDATTVTLRMGVHIDVEATTVVIKPLADEIALAIDAAQVAIGNLLRSRLDTVPVFYGAP